MTAVVILPGLDATAVLLQEFSSRLSGLGSPARVIAYPPDLVLGYTQLELLVRAQLPVSQPFVLLGESFSGPLAIRVAANPPPGLVGLVLSTTFARAPMAGLLPFAPLLRFAPVRPPMRVLRWLLLGRWATSTLQAQLTLALGSVSPAVLRARAAAALGENVAALLPSITVPVLQLVAAQDRLLSRSAFAALAAGLAHCRTVRIEGPHLLLQTATQACAQEVTAFALGLGPEVSFEPTPLRCVS
jgi:pimeloyl-ACP methyl ester carboxylesterase